jgi:hypothetical protein
MVCIFILLFSNLCTGTYYYMCTRNNNFSNRSQKGTLTVAPADDTRIVIGAVVGSVAGGAAAVGTGVAAAWAVKTGKLVRRRVG